MQLDVTSTPTGLRLADAMRAAIEAAAGEHGRVSKKRVQEQWAVFFAGIRWSDREYARVLKRRTQEAQIARLTAWAQDAKTQPVDLKRKARSLAYRQRQAVEEGHQAKAYALGLQANAIEDEIEARILRGEIRRKQPSRRTSVQPAPLVEAGEGHQEEPYRACVPSPSVVVLPRIELQQVQAGAVSGSAAPYAPEADGTPYAVAMIGRFRQRVQQGAPA